MNLVNLWNKMPLQQIALAVIPFGEGLFGFAALICLGLFQKGGTRFPALPAYISIALVPAVTGLMLACARFQHVLHSLALIGRAPRRPWHWNPPNP